jgi:hypothetical protein
LCYHILNNDAGFRLNIKEGGDYTMKKILAMVLSLITLATTLTFVVGCKKVETPKPAEEQTVAPTEPAPAPGETGEEAEVAPAPKETDKE